ncbi:MAG TPA: hypothetical protein PLX69_17025 [Leptospiraceae bacterium]|nr:hypothetical protein [Leptospiraceae bacterium]HRG76266.1 hypothetical protein [Leptospiraceae bacterium]
MLNRSTIHEEVREFFDTKNNLIREIERYEKKVYSEKQDLARIQKILDQLWTLVDKSNSEYFRVRLVTLDKLLKRNAEKRTYRKIEFDRIFKILSKIKEDDGVEFLNEGLRNRIEKISERLFRTTHHLEPETEDKFYLLTYKSLSFIVRSYEKKILQDVDARKSYVRIKNKRYPLFPAYTGLKTDDEDFQLDYCNVLILKVRTDYKCFRFDHIETVSDISYDYLNAKMIPLEEPIQEIKHYIRLRGKRVYYLDV